MYLRKTMIESPFVDYLEYVHEEMGGEVGGISRRVWFWRCGVFFCATVIRVSAGNAMWNVITM